VVAAAAFAGLVLGVGALIVALALLSGFQNHIKDRLISETPHVTVRPKARAEFLPSDGLLPVLEKLAGVEKVSPFVRGRVWVTQSSRSAPADAVGRENLKGITTDPGLANSLGLLPGVELTLVSSRTRLSPLGPVPIVISQTLTRVVPPVTSRRKPELELPIEDARRLMALPDEAASGYEVRLKEPADPSEIADAIANRFPDVLVTTWEDSNRPLVAALKLERIVLFTTISLIVIVAGLNLAAITAVLAATRAGDAAVLAVLGASPMMVGRVFLAAGVLLGTAGTAVGAMLGSSVAFLLDRYQLLPLPSRLYSIDHVPFRLDGLDLTAVVVLAFVWSVLVSYVPARAVARMNTVEVLRAAG
jgi:lipoprotein-releasing system permease protein